MYRFLLYNLLFLLFIPLVSVGQSCEMTAVTATPQPCNGYYFYVSIDISVTNSSPGFTLAGNGVIYGTFLYDDLPVIVGPLLGDNESVYEFIAWDVENPDCQQFTTLDPVDCGPICHFSNATLDSLSCLTNISALLELDFVVENPPSAAFDIIDVSGNVLSSHLYASLPVTLNYFPVNGSEPIILTICDQNNESCCETFEFPAIDCNPNNCEIYNVSIDPECTGANFLVHLDFDTTNVVSDSFTVMGNSLNYGKFGYDELPLTLGPLNGQTNIVWEFIIRDSGNPNCQKVAMLGIYNCPPPCDILSIEADPLVCNGNEGYSLFINLEIEGEGDNGFAVFSENAYYGTFLYDNLPITLPFYENSNDIDLVTVCDNENPGCCATVEYLALVCSGCLIYNLEATPIPCNEENEIYVELDFDYQNVSQEGFSVSGNMQQFGNFSYDEVPVLIGPFPGDSANYLEFVVTDLVNGDCFDALEIGLLACGDICELSNLVVETGECTGNNTYMLSLDFDFQSVGPLGFDLFANGELIGTYSYGSLPLTVQEFPGSGNDLDTVTVCDNVNPDCCTSLVFFAPDCQCDIFETTVEFIGCTSDSTFGVELEFFYENLPGDFVDVYFDGVWLGFFSVNDIPLQVNNIPEGDGTGILTVCANDLNSCCDEVVVNLVNCEGPQCSIVELFAEAGSCNSDSTFVLDIDFNYNNLPVDSVLIYANEELIGQYAVDTAFIHIENFPVLGDLTHLLVCAVGAPDCCDDYTLETPDCDTTDCEIYDLIATPGDCNTDSTYNLTIVYNAENIPGDSVDVIVNGIFVGTFSSPSHQINILNFPWQDGDIAEVSVCSVAFPDCCDFDSYEIPNCPGPTACNIFELAVVIGECQSDSTYNLTIDFQFDNLPSDSVVITANEQNIGTFHVNEGHIVIENFPVFPGNQTGLHVCALGAPDCCDAVEFETPDCGGGGPCDIFELDVNVEECTSDSTYTLVVNFGFANLPDDSVIITANEELIGHFQLQEGHIIIPNFPVFPNDHTFITVCAVGAPDCCASLEFITPVCDGSCHLFDLQAEVGGCTSDTTFQLDFIFESFNLPVDSVTVHAGDLFIGQYFNNPDFIRIENFPLLPGETTTITVCGVGAPDCCDTFTFENPSCAGECDIFEVSVDVGDCSSDTTFGVVINFQYENISGGGFDVYTGEGYLGFFNFEQIPIVTENFPANSTGEYVVTICENDNLECCESFEFEGPVCVEVCDISNLEWSVTECDSAGNFYFILNFDFQNVGTGGFNVVGNGNVYGNFSYDSLPIEIGPFESGSNIVFEFLVTDAQNSACFDFVEPGMVDCIVATEEIDRENIFQVYNNGSLPGILSLKEVKLSLFNSNGKMLVSHKTLNEGSFYELAELPGGMYIGSIMYQNNIWPVKLVKSSY